MAHRLLRLELRYEHDVVLARQRARRIADLLGYDNTEQIRIATATSEIARNAFRYATKGSVEFAIDDNGKHQLTVTVQDSGPGIPHLDSVLSGKYQSNSGLGMGIVGTKRLMDSFSIESSPTGTLVVFGKALPGKHPLSSKDIGRLGTELANAAARSPFEEIQSQNQELLRTLDELRAKKDELSRINLELEDTNRGVVALYAELDERADYLRRASELKSSFLSNMSHEFRTPLNSIMSLSRMLLDRMDGELTVDQAKQVGYIQKSAHDLAEMVNDLLDLAKVEAGKVEIKPKIFEVADLFGALRGMLKPLLAENSVSLVFDDADGLPDLYTDEAKVSQILRNFISNAIKFTPKGEVRVGAKLVNDKTIEFSVSDTGIGIAIADQQIIFEEFRQIDGEMQHRVKGTGLGLPLAKRFSELLGGTVSVESKVGMGSRFSTTIPIHYPAAPLPATRAVLPPLDPNRLPILVVEDNTETQFIYMRYFEFTEFQLICARTVDEAKLIIAELKPSAILLDIVLSAENTWKFISELKRNADSIDIPVIVVSVVDDARRAYGMGAEYFLRKPFDPDQLIRTVREAAPSAKTEISALLIDDNEVARYVLRNLLDDFRVSVTEARGGREGVETAKRLCPNIIFLDLMMPDITGFEVMQELKASNITRDIPVVIHSSKHLTEAEKATIAEGSVAILPKDLLNTAEARRQVSELLKTYVPTSAGGRRQHA